MIPFTIKCYSWNTHVQVYAANTEKYPNQNWGFEIKLKVSPDKFHFLLFASTYLLASKTTCFLNLSTRQEDTNSLNVFLLEEYAIKQLLNLTKLWKNTKRLGFTQINYMTLYSKFTVLHEPIWAYNPFQWSNAQLHDPTTDIQGHIALVFVIIYKWIVYKLKLLQSKSNLQLSIIWM